MNRVELIGRIASDINEKVDGNVERASFILAVPRQYAGPGKEPVTDFIPIVVWRQTAQFAATYLKKGMRIGACGRMESYRHKESDGKEQVRISVVADHLEFADGKSNPAAQKEPPKQPYAPSAAPVSEQAPMPGQNEEAQPEKDEDTPWDIEF